MRDIIIQVGYQYVYDLYFRVRNAALQNKIYSLDFADWIKAGLAFNALGTSVPNRHPAYFGYLYTHILANEISLGLDDLKQAVIDFYTDIFNLYQDHLLAQLRAERSSKGVVPADFLVIPTFNQVEKVKVLLTSVDIVLSEYECKHPDDLSQAASTIFYTESDILHAGMSLMYDYGVKGEGNGIILEVK